MKTSFYSHYGSPDVLQIKEGNKPIPNKKEVLVKVYAATVNRSDCAMLLAKPFIMRFFTGLLKPNRTILGTDFAGQIETIGEGVQSFKVGDKVFGFDDGGLSSHAQYMIFSEDDAMAIIPKGLSYELAAASIEGAHYAYNMINKVDLLPGHRVLVNGATGAIGSAAVQLLKHFGAHVTAVCDKKNGSLMMTIGADIVIDYNQDDFTQKGDKYHFIFDAVGKNTFGKCKPLLEPGGAYISSELGPWAQNLFFALLAPMMGKKKVVFPFPENRKRSVLLIKQLMEEGKFSPVIDRRYPLEEIADAFNYVLKGYKTGNVIIKIT